jgi:hypothetical protein
LEAGLRCAETPDAGRLAAVAGVRGVAGRFAAEAFAALEGRAVDVDGRLAGTAGREPAVRLLGMVVRLATGAGCLALLEPSDGKTAPRNSTSNVPHPAIAAK